VRAVTALAMLDGQHVAYDKRRSMTVAMASCWLSRWACPLAQKLLTPTVSGDPTPHDDGHQEGKQTSIGVGILEKNPSTDKTPSAIARPTADSAKARQPRSRQIQPGRWATAKSLTNPLARSDRGIV
jgi:hypothetical protein